VLNCANRDELSELIEIITQSHKPHPDSVAKSVWGMYLLSKCNRDVRAQSVDKFLQCVADTLDKSQVKDLVQHECNNGVSTIKLVATNRKSRGLVQAMLFSPSDRGRSGWSVASYWRTSIWWNKSSLASTSTENSFAPSLQQWRGEWVDYCSFFIFVISLQCWFHRRQSAKNIWDQLTSAHVSKIGNSSTLLARWYI
jgi:hypothetical protein